MLKFIISKDYQIKSIYINQSNEEEIIYLKQGKEWYLSTLHFDNNEIQIDYDNSNDINTFQPLKDIIETPNEMKEYQFTL